MSDLKSDLADEFNHLNSEIERLQAELREAQATISRICDAFMIGENVRNKQTIMVNLNNAIRRSNCLSAIENKFFTRTIMDDEEGEFDECYLLWGATPEEYVKQFGAVLEDRDGAIEELIIRLSTQSSREKALVKAVEKLSKIFESDEYGWKCDSTKALQTCIQVVEAFRAIKEKA